VRLLVVGAGGHAKVVMDAAMAAGHEIAGIVGAVTDPAELLGVPVSASADDIDADGFIVAIGENAVRAEHFARYSAAGHIPLAVIHPSAVLGTGVEIGAGAFLAPGVIVNTDARIGADAILNTGCSVDHDCTIGPHAHIGPQVALCGGVSVGEGALIGVGACASPGVHVGPRAVIGAGAAIVEDLPGDHVCVGVPARALRAVRRDA
jgi:sugar O-acyltransferase (sialic acid O-acetyltransferase NeuD family)